MVVDRLGTKGDNAIVDLSDPGGAYGAPAERVTELLARLGIDGFDACGENGEYHTTVLGGPGFRYELCWREPRVVAGPGYHFLECAAVERDL